MRKTFAIFMLSIILSWTILPSIAMAGWLTPGQPIKVTDPITGGEPITGGQPFSGEFMTPGEVFTYGSSYEGNFPPVSGTIIVPVYAVNNGLFLIPSTLNGTEYGEFLKENAAITGGQAITGGNGPGGNGSTGGNGPTGGNGSTGGNGPTGGNGSTGGNGPTGGEGSTGGDGSTDGNGPNGSSTDSGNGTSGNATGGGPTIENAPSNDGEKSLGEQAKTLNTNQKRFFTALDGGLSMYAGFKITDMKTAKGNRNLYSVHGKATILKGDNRFSKWVNKRYSNYLNSFDNRRDVIIGNSNGEYKPRDGKQIKKKHISGFMKEISSPKKIGKDVKSYLKNNWVPNKDFFKLKTIMKGNGIVNVVLSVSSNIGQGKTGTSLAAGITTDVVVGAATTAVSAAAAIGTAAATGAMFGSVVPGLGTVVGVGAGIAFGLLTQTSVGKKITGAIETGAKKLYDGAVNLGKSMFKKFGWGS